jgi:polyphosphate kinase 2 (PPK2 family)
MGRLDRLDLSLELSGEEEAERLEAGWERLEVLRLALAGKLHYLQRFWPALPGLGGKAILDRSWYGRVLVERVEGLATEEEWRRAYGEIVELERWLTDSGMLEAAEEMFERTDTDYAPWQLVEAEDKKYARVKVVETVIERMEAGMRAAGIQPPSLT